MTRCFHIISHLANEQEINVVLLELTKAKIKFVLWNTNPEIQPTDNIFSHFSKSSFLDRLEEQDIVCWIHSGESFSLETFSRIEKEFNNNEEILMIYGDENNDSGYEMKPDFSPIFLLDRNYIGDGAFVLGKHILNNPKVINPRHPYNNYSVLVSLIDVKDKVKHIDEYILRNNMYISRRCSELVSMNKIVLSMYLKDFFNFGITGNSHRITRQHYYERVAVFVILNELELSIQKEQCICNKLPDSNFEIVFVMREHVIIKRGNTRIIHQLFGDSIGERLNHAVELSISDVCLFMDSTTEPLRGDGVYALLDALVCNNKAAVSPMIIRNGDGTILSAGEVLGCNDAISGAFMGRKYSHINNVSFNQFAMHECSTVSGKAFLIDRTVFLFQGGFSGDIQKLNEVFWDFGLKLNDNGIACVYDPFSVFVSEEEYSTGVSKELIQKWDLYRRNDIFYTDNMKTRYLSRQRDNDIIRRENIRREREKSISTKIGNVCLCDEVYYCSELFEQKYDILIPVYNGYQYLDKLFAGIRKTKLKYRLIIVNDCSPDERVLPLLKKVVNEEREAILIEHRENVGFVGSINDALRKSDNHVAIVNTDVELPNEWLERLMMPIVLEKSVASSTPFTNSGTICSFPNFVEDNEIFLGHSVDTIDCAFKYIVPRYTEIPTGVGFCMGMSKEAINEVGLLDEKAFGKGYGEENDWCCRVIDAGYKNVHVDNLFVYHNHGGSFMPEEKKKLVAEHLRILGELHPYYHMNVSAFVQNDPYKDERIYAQLILMSNQQGIKNLYISFAWTGGANAYLLNRKKENLDNKEAYWEFVFDDKSDSYSIEAIYLENACKFVDLSYDFAMGVLKKISFDRIIINELVSFPNVPNILKDILDIQHGEMDYLMHDYFAICPSYTLTNKRHVFCGIPSEKDCSICFASDSRLKNKCESIVIWREAFYNFLKCCSRVICFSEDGKRIVESVYCLNNVYVVPHKTVALPKANVTCKNEKITIAVMGGINEIKGLKILNEMKAIIDYMDYPIKIIIIGKCQIEYNTSGFLVTGGYEREELPELMRKNKIDIVFIPSVWPETFSYTTQEAVDMDMPLAVFDVGAPALRVKQYHKGLVISKIDAETAVEEMIAFSKNVKKYE